METTTSIGGNKIMKESFWKGALCAEVDPELFFPLKGKFLDAQNAKRICNRCELKQKCLESMR